MATSIPHIGEWYFDRQSDTSFEVVAIDETQMTIAIQYDSGDIDEIELEQWSSHRFESSCAPDDATGTYGLVEDDEWEDSGTLGEDMNLFSNRFDTDQAQDFDDFV